MARKKRKKSSVRPSPKRPCPERMAEILICTDIETVQATSAKYGVSERTIWRWKAALTAGELPEVADLVAQLKDAATQRCKDLLGETFEAALRRIVAQLQTASIAEAVKAAEMCGDLLIARKTKTIEVDLPQLRRDVATMNASQLEAEARAALDAVATGNNDRRE